jgi:dGTP triphosphohydrolase
MQSFLAYVEVFTASGLNQHDRTRLTHSLEVNQIAIMIVPIGIQYMKIYVG